MASSGGDCGMHEEERRKLLDVLAETPDQLEAVLLDLTPELARWNPAPGKWSILQIVCHMRDMEKDAYLARYRRLLAEEQPQLADIDGDALALESDYASQSLAAAFQDWKRLRRQTLALIDGLQPLSSAQWERGGVHEGVGPMTMEGYLKRQASGNDLAHFGQIRSIKERWVLLQRLRSAPDRLAELTAGLSEAVLRTKPAGGGWSVVQNACHLRDIEQLFLERFSKMACQDKPRLSTIDNDRMAESRAYSAARVEEVVAEFARLRSETLTLLRALPHTLWQRTGVHPKRGELSIQGLATLLAGHDGSHLDRIAELAAGTGPSGPADCALATTTAEQAS
ncbi:MAG: DinB family protein [Thermoanaerobaculia bacterium]